MIGGTRPPSLLPNCPRGGVPACPLLEPPPPYLGKRPRRDVMRVCLRDALAASIDGGAGGVAADGQDRHTCAARTAVGEAGSLKVGTSPRPRPHTELPPRIRFLRRRRSPSRRPQASAPAPLPAEGRAERGSGTAEEKIPWEVNK